MDNDDEEEVAPIVQKARPVWEKHTPNKEVKLDENQRVSLHAAKMSPIRPVLQSDNKNEKRLRKRKNKNENILCAIIALMKELDKPGLEFVKMDAKKRISKLEEKSKNKMGSESSESDDWI